MKSSKYEIAIQLENVQKKYIVGAGDFWALNGISLQIEKGELVAIVGKSGSGKSTLLNILGGIDTPTAGTVIVGGESLREMSENKLCHFRRKTIGFVFQFFQLMPTLTALENVIMPMDFASQFSSSERRTRAISLLKKVGIESHANKFPTSLSGGEQQRVAIARSLANDPEIILTDEPTGNLDSKTAEEIWGLLQSLSHDGKSVVMVTHNQEFSRQCERVITISDGIIIGDNRKAGEKGVSE